jgi:hypothetical protein
MLRVHVLLDTTDDWLTPYSSTQHYRMIFTMTNSVFDDDVYQTQIVDPRTEIRIILLYLVISVVRRLRPRQGSQGTGLDRGLVPCGPTNRTNIENPVIYCNGVFSNHVSTSFLNTEDRHLADVDTSASSYRNTIPHVK